LVVDLQVGPGRVAAIVSGSTTYDVMVTVHPLPPARWNAICKDCSGAIDSLVELLQGRFAKGVMTRLCEEKTGLFPSPAEILFTCSCPDWASMCKHVAAVLYAIGARLDHQPELLFTLRKVDQQDLIARAGSDLSKTSAPLTGTKVLVSDNLAEMFGIEMAPAPPPTRAEASAVVKAAVGIRSDPSSRQTRSTKRAEARAPASTRRSARRAMTPEQRRAISERMRTLWAARRSLLKK
jgi:uncharacterized Zn finger protein